MGTVFTGSKFECDVSNSFFLDPVQICYDSETFEFTIKYLSGDEANRLLQLIEAIGFTPKVAKDADDARKAAKEKVKGKPWSAKKPKSDEEEESKEDAPNGVPKKDKQKTDSEQVETTDEIRKELVAAIASKEIKNISRLFNFFYNKDCKTDKAIFEMVVKYRDLVPSLAKYSDAALYERIERFIQMQP